MTDRDYAIKSMKEITFQMASHAQDYLEVTIERHYTDIKELMTSYQKLILENQIVLEELDMECQEKINEDMAYALSYLSIYNNQLNVPKMHREMNNLMIIYGLSDMIYRGMTLTYCLFRPSKFQEHIVLFFYYNIFIVSEHFAVIIIR